MKTLFVILFSMGFTLASSAQVHGGGHGGFVGHSGFSSHGSIGIGAFPFSYGYGYPYRTYPFFYGYGYNSRPTRLDFEIQDIKADYQDKIWSAKKDNTLSRHEKRKVIKNLKRERDSDIIAAQRNYYKKGRY
jgi:hypothetical protein